MPRKAKPIATASLGVMAAGFAGTLALPAHAGIALLQGGFEAGLVGGLADWFAVTALFRRPLGLPIPHTALLPRNRERVIQALIDAVENELLSKESLLRKVEAFPVAERLFALLENHAPEIAKAAASLGERLVRDFPVERAVPPLLEAIGRFVEGIDTAAVLRELERQVIARGYDERALEYALDKAESFIHRDAVRQYLGSMAASALANVRTGGLMGFAVNAFAGFMSEEKLGGMLQTAIASALRDMRSLPEHPLRTILLGEARRALEQLPDNADVLREAGKLKEQALDAFDAERRLTEWLEALRERALAFVREASFAERWVQPLLEKLLTDLRSDTAAGEAVQRWVQDRAARLLEDNHDKIGMLIRENLDKLDNETLIRMMEDKIGQDIQWIRVNGALCGFLIGLALAGIRLAT